jgi:bacterioferritin-associated ferredoxin
MYVCYCRAVTDGRIKAAIQAGARDCASVGAQCGAGTGCGGCLPALRALLAEMCCGEDAPARSVAGQAA